MKTDLQCPSLITDDRSDVRDVVQFYEEFEDVCGLANNCNGMNFREKLLALRARCRGSRLKTISERVQGGIQDRRGYGQPAGSL